MSDQAAVEGEAAAALAGPRFSIRTGSLLAFGGSAAIAFILAQLVLWVWTDAPLVVLTLAAAAYGIALLVWAGLWKRPLAIAAVVGAALVGLLAGLFMATMVTSLIDVRPET